MRTRILLVVIALSLVAPLWAASAPVVTGVTAAPRTDNSQKVDIRYHLADADGDKCTVWVQVSNDGGSTWTTPAGALSGAVGPDICPGHDKLITWDTGADPPEVYGSRYQVKVVADDSPVPADMAYIPAGTFQMGDSKNEGYPDELPVRTVTLDQFYLGKYEITNSQYCDFLNSALGQGLIADPANTSSMVHKAGGTGHPYCDTYQSSVWSQIDWSGSAFSVRTKSGRSMANDPMVRVSWYGAVAYCNWRSQQEGKEQCYDLSDWTCDFSKKGYRLATEAEWEYAARGGLAGKRFPWGDTISQTQANFNSSSRHAYDVSPVQDQYHPLWNDGDNYPHTSPVGFFDGTIKCKSSYDWPGSASSYQTAHGGNGFGLHDMAGNVFEWCNDWYAAYSPGPQTNPTGPTSGIYRVLRGGSLNYYADLCRCASRVYDGAPVRRLYYYGFRVALDLH